MQRFKFSTPPIWRAFVVVLFVLLWGGSSCSSPVVVPDGSNTDGTSSQDSGGNTDSTPSDQHTGTDHATPDNSPKDTNPSDAGAPDQNKPDNGQIACKHDCDCIDVGKVCDGQFCASLRRPTNCVSCDSDACKPGDPCLAKDTKFGVCPSSTSCKHDCDCIGQQKVCHTDNTCQSLNRPSNCLECEGGKCIKGEPCIQVDRKIGVCGGKPCKHDCDCASSNQVCDSGACAFLQRVSLCVACDSGACKPGEPCLEKDSNLGTCPGTVSCKHDCDCAKIGQVCHTDNTCQPLKRPTNCLPCDGACKQGDPCLKQDGAIGVCGNTTTCKHDCDCYKDGKVCNQGTCLAMGRPSTCVPCNGGNCTPGSPCIDANGGIGVCPGNIACTSDCECVKHSLNCDGGVCSPTKRINQCPSCLSSTCPANALCYDQNKDVALCGGGALPSCNDKACARNTPCKKSDGTLGLCCCTISGCNTGFKCCSNSGTPPPPGHCGFACQAVTQCIPVP